MPDPIPVSAPAAPPPAAADPFAALDAADAQAAQGQHSQPSADPFAALDAAQAQAGHPVAGPSGSFGTDALRFLGTAGANALASTLSLPYVAASAADAVPGWFGYHPDLAGKLNSVSTPGSPGTPLFPNPEQARQMAFATTGGTEYVPSTGLERMGLAAASAAPFGLAGGLGGIIPAAVGGATGEAAAEVVPGHPVAAGLIGALAGAGGASSLGNLATRTVGAATGTAPTTPLFQAYQRQGVPTALSGDVTQQPGLQLAQSMAAKLPGGSEAVGHAVNEAVQAWQDAAERSAASLGNASTLQDAGTGLQQAAQQWLQDWKSNSNAKWNAFQQAVPPQTPITVGSFQKALTDVNQNFGGAAGLAKALQPGLGQKLQDALATDISPTGTLPWQAVQATRTRLGEMLEGGQPVADTAQSAIKRLYGSLSDDMRNGANQASPQAAQAFNQANAYTAFGHTLLEDHLNPVLSATNPEQAAQYALAQAKAGGSRLAMLNFNLPGQAQNLGAAVLRQAADAGPSALLTKLKGLSPEAQQQLFNTPANPAQAAPGAMTTAGQGVSDLSAIAQAMRNTVQRFGNNSNTAAHESSGLGRVMSAIELAKQGREIGGGFGAAAGAGLGFFAPTAVGKGASVLGANPLLSRLYSTQLAPLTAPAMVPNVLFQTGMQDQRNLAPNGLPSTP